MITVECEKVHETGAAVLIQVDDEKIWIPFSQVDSMHFDQKGRGHICISDWIAKQKGLG